MILGGKCRKCAEPVSIQYPLVELATGLVWAGLFVLHGPTWEALRGSIFLTIVFGISISDARYYIIPDEFSIGGTVIGILLAFLPGGLQWRLPQLLSDVPFAEGVVPAVAGAAVGWFVLWFVAVAGTWIIKKISPGRLEDAGVDQAMGGGDIKMMMMVGSFVGLWGVALTIFLGSVFALATVLVRSLFAQLRGGSDDEEFTRLIPFGVFLAAGGGVAYMWGEAIVGWYMKAVLGI